MAKTGKLFLIPNTLGNVALSRVIPSWVIDQVKEIKHFIVENPKDARAFLKKVESNFEQSEFVFSVLNKHTSNEEKYNFLDPIAKGENIGIITDAGCPGIADPGAEMVKLAHDNNYQVVPFVGPSSILLAHMASGMNGQSFAFNGYLPIDKMDRKKRLKSLEKQSRDFDQAQSFIETPYRNVKMVEEILSTCSPSTQLCIACDISLDTEFIKTMPVKAWKKNLLNTLHKRPCIFIIQA